MFLISSPVSFCITFVSDISFVNPKRTKYTLGKIPCHHEETAKTFKVLEDLEGVNRFQRSGSGENPCHHGDTKTFKVSEDLEGFNRFQRSVNKEQEGKNRQEEMINFLS